MGQTMIRLPRRTRRVSLVLVINFVCILIISLFGTISWLFFHKNIQKDFTTLVSHFKTNHEITTSQSTVTTISSAIKKKIDNMKRELNDSTLNNETMFPANRIGRYLLLNPNLCKNSNHINIVIIVHTAPANFENRQRIRDSFGQHNLFQPFQIRVAFLLGDTSNKVLEKILWLEHLRYNDTVMGDFIDHYHNLSLKGVMGYHWVSEYCSNSDFVLKIDDDVLVNMFKLLYSFLPHMLGKKKSIFCNLWSKGRMPILRKGKWKVESHVFSSMSRFPYDYCSGFVVLLTSDLMRSMYEAAKITPFFWIDDIYLFGMLPSVVGGVTYYNYALNKNITMKENIAINCTMSQGPKCSIFATIISSRSYWDYWDMIKETYVVTKWALIKKIVY